MIFSSYKNNIQFFIFSNYFTVIIFYLYLLISKLYKVIKMGRYSRNNRKHYSLISNGSNRSDGGIDEMRGGGEKLKKIGQKMSRGIGKTGSFLKSSAVAVGSAPAIVGKFGATAARSAVSVAKAPVALVKKGFATYNSSQKNKKLKTALGVEANVGKMLSKKEKYNSLEEKLKAKEAALNALSNKNKTSKSASKKRKAIDKQRLALVQKRAALFSTEEGTKGSKYGYDALLDKMQSNKKEKGKPFNRKEFLTKTPQEQAQVVQEYIANKSKNEVKTAKSEKAATALATATQKRIEADEQVKRLSNVTTKEKNILQSLDTEYSKLEAERAKIPTNTKEDLEKRANILKQMSVVQKNRESQKEKIQQAEKKGITQQKILLQIKSAEEKAQLAKNRATTTIGNLVSQAKASYEAKKQAGIKGYGQSIAKGWSGNNWKDVKEGIMEGDIGKTYGSAARSFQNLGRTTLNTVGKLTLIKPLAQGIAKVGTSIDRAISNNNNMPFRSTSAKIKSVAKEVQAIQKVKTEKEKQAGQYKQNLTTSEANLKTLENEIKDLNQKIIAGTADDKTKITLQDKLKTKANEINKINENKLKLATATQELNVLSNKELARKQVLQKFQARKKEKDVYKLKANTLAADINRSLSADTNYLSGDGKKILENLKKLPNETPESYQRRVQSQITTLDKLLSSSNTTGIEGLQKVKNMARYISKNAKLSKKMGNLTILKPELNEGAKQRTEANFLKPEIVAALAKKKEEILQQFQDTQAIIEERKVELQQLEKNKANPKEIQRIRNLIITKEQNEKMLKERLNRADEGLQKASEIQRKQIESEIQTTIEKNKQNRIQLNAQEDKQYEAVMKANQKGYEEFQVLREKNANLQSELREMQTRIRSIPMTHEESRQLTELIAKTQKEVDASKLEKLNKQKTVFQTYLDSLPPDSPQRNEYDNKVKALISESESVKAIIEATKADEQLQANRQVEPEPKPTEKTAATPVAASATNQALIAPKPENTQNKTPSFKELIQKLRAEKGQPQKPQNLLTDNEAEEYKRHFIEEIKDPESRDFFLKLSPEERRNLIRVSEEQYNKMGFSNIAVKQHYNNDSKINNKNYKFISEEIKPNINTPEFQEISTKLENIKTNQQRLIEQAQREGLTDDINKKIIQLNREEYETINEQNKIILTELLSKQQSIKNKPENKSQLENINNAIKYQEERINFLNKSSINEENQPNAVPTATTTNATRAANAAATPGASTTATPVAGAAPEERGTQAPAPTGAASNRTRANAAPSTGAASNKTGTQAPAPTAASTPAGAAQAAASQGATPVVKPVEGIVAPTPEQAAASQGATPAAAKQPKSNVEILERLKNKDFRNKLKNPNLASNNNKADIERAKEIIIRQKAKRSKPPTKKTLERAIRRMLSKTKTSNVLSVDIQPIFNKYKIGGINLSKNEIQNIRNQVMGSRTLSFTNPLYNTKSSEENHYLTIGTTNEKTDKGGEYMELKPLTGGSRKHIPTHKKHSPTHKKHSPTRKNNSGSNKKHTKKNNNNKRKTKKNN